MYAMKSWKEDDYVEGDFQIKIWLLFKKSCCEFISIKKKRYWNL